MSRIRVPLAVDAQLRIPIGPLQLPIATCIALGAALLPAALVFELPFSLGLRLTCVSAVFGVAVAMASPRREGIWIGNHYLVKWAVWFASRKPKWKIARLLNPLRDRVALWIGKARVEGHLSMLRIS